MRRIIPDGEGLARIPIDQLVLDSGNPRIPGMEETEAETIGLMLRDQKRAGTNKLVALATSIAEHGYSANEPLLVKPLGDDRFLVVEGNRRVTAMKLAVSPSLLPAEFSDLTKRFEALGEAMADIEPFCLVSENDEYLRRMMWLRHSGTGVFSQVLLSEKSAHFFRVCARNFFGFRHARTVSPRTSPA